MGCMKIAIAGYGLEGESNYRYWSIDRDNDITIVDQKQPNLDIPNGTETIIGEDAFEKLDGFDLVIRTAGLAPRKIKTDGKIWSATNEFFAKCPCPIIGVTGTKGKGTTASLIASILELSGRNIWLLGNIGKPSLDALGDIQQSDIVVYELSSFQLWDLEKSPHVAVVLLVEPDHLDVHIDFNEYVSSKANIRRYQKDGDICIFHPTNQVSLQISEVSTAGKAMRYGVTDDGGVYEAEGEFRQLEQKICSTDVLQLIGRHNIENACAAITVAKFYGVSNESIEEGLKNFKGLPHRIEFIRIVDGVSYYNDSFSSAPPAAVAAIKSFQQPEIIIMGGVDRGTDFSHVAQTIAQQGNIKSIIVIGEVRDKLSKILREANQNIDIKVSDSRDLSEIIDLAKSKAKDGDVIILSPGCPSFDMFKDFYDRGNQFRVEVNKL